MNQHSIHPLNTIYLLMESRVAFLHFHAVKNINLLEFSPILWYKFPKEDDLEKNIDLHYLFFIHKHSRIYWLFVYFWSSPPSPAPLAPLSSLVLFSATPPTTSLRMSGAKTSVASYRPIQKGFLLIKKWHHWHLIIHFVFYKDQFFHLGWYTDILHLLGVDK